MKFYLVYKNNGLYDPVLDDFEPIYDQIEQEDFDQPSQPTEVDPFGIQQFLDQNNPAPQDQGSVQLPELLDIETRALTDDNELQSRSLTASPFLLPTKPYRPFSTEPLPIPPLEDPIILNPDYKDQFGKLDDGDILPETRFKLPISEQYDPDGSKKKGKALSENSAKKDVTFEERAKKETKTSEEMQHKLMVDEVKFMEKMKKEIDIDKIEMTAVNLVEESIQRAVSVTDEIKKEIDIELSVSMISSEVKESKVIHESKSAKEAVTTTKILSEKSSNVASELVDLIDKTTEEVIGYNGSKSEVTVAKQVEKFEACETKEENEAINERKLCTKKEMEESIVSGTVRKKSEAFDKTLEVNCEVNSLDSEQSVQKRKSSEVLVKDRVTSKTYVNEISGKKESIKGNAEKASEVTKESISLSQNTSVKSESNASKHRAYTIGLQTIPNIKGTIHSSYHYNLLLKTFFIHLTDVMVALSRFILTEPVFNKEETEERKNVSVSSHSSEIISEQNKYFNEETLVNENQKGKDEQTVQKAKETKQKETAYQEIIAEKQVNVAAETSSKSEDIKVIEYGKVDDVKEYLDVEEAIETRMLSGAKMAQLSERKSEELTQKMDAVISEFENKAGIEASIEVRERRSRSRSRMEDEVAKESDPLEWLSKVDKQIQESTQVKTESKSFSSSSESLKNNRTETTEKRESKTSKVKEGKQMYVAIVESHVFTNEDAIFEEQRTEFTETSSVQSSDKVNVASQANNLVSVEKITKESNEIKEEAAEAVVKDCNEQAIVNAENKVVKIKHDIKTVIEEASEMKAVKINAIKKIDDVVVKEIVEPVIEIEELQISCINEDIHKTDIKEEEHVKVVEQTEYLVEETNHGTVHEIKEEEQAYEELCHETTVQSIKADMQDVKEVEIQKSVEAIELSVVHPVKLNISKEEASSQLKIVKEQVLEVEEMLKLTEESEHFVNKQTKIVETDSQFTVSQKSTMENFESKEIVQESSFTAKMADQSKKLTLQMDLAEQYRSQSQNSVQSGPPSTIDTPTPATVPPTPLTDEYVFKLQIPLPKTPTTIIPRDCTPSPIDEDPHIVKKKLIAHIDTTLDSPIIYDPPLHTPPEDKVISPVYTKPGLRGGTDRKEFRRAEVSKKKEEILEIERKSSLLASAIDETIKSIEEYKEEVGIETKKEIEAEDFNIIENNTSKVFEEQKAIKPETNKENQAIIYNGYAKVETKVYNSIQNHNSKMDDEWNHIDKQVKDTNEKVSELSSKVNGEKAEKETEIKTELRQEERRLSETAVNKPDAVKEPEKAKENQVSEDCIDTSASFKIKLTSEEKPAAMINSPPAMFIAEEKKDLLEGYRPVQFNPDELIATKKNLQSVYLTPQAPMQRATSPSYVGASGEVLGTHQGIVDGLEEAVVDAEVAKELGKPGMTEEKIAELISGESEMLREAHVMGLSRVLKSHMHRADDDSSVDFKKIKPIIESLKDSEVLKALNEELIRTQEEKKKKEEQKKWTTFLQKPKRPVPRAKFGYYGYIEPEVEIEEPYKVKIVKQPKPKVAPDYKPEDFETGPLPWEERALSEPPPPPVDAEDPILIPEEIPEFLEAVDPLPESEIPDLEETGIPLPPPKTEEELQSSPVPVAEDKEDTEEQPEELDIEAVVEETERIVEEMEQNKLAEQLLSGVQSMVDPNASVEQQLSQMRAQLAALAQLPNVIQQTLDLVSHQLCQLTQQEAHQTNAYQPQPLMAVEEIPENVEVNEIQTDDTAEIESEEDQQVTEETITNTSVVEEETKPSMSEEEREKLKKEEEEMLEEQRRIEKQKKELMEQMRLEQESRQVKQRPTPRVGKPKPVFGPPVPVDRPLVLPGGRKWRKPQDAYNEQFIAETLSAQAEIIKGKAKGINFMKYEKPPVSLDHLQQSETYKLIHNMEQTPAKRVEMRTPVIAEADYREKCRSVTPAHMNMPQQVHP